MKIKILFSLIMLSVTYTAIADGPPAVGEGAGCVPAGSCECITQGVTPAASGTPAPTATPDPATPGVHH